ncbi:MAG: hypothetical protein NTY44_13675, partial [Deltaproteobacteria bacterium]|nr:hypothetical protein [Deltaproteobacteria bacterium]
FLSSFSGLLFNLLGSFEFGPFEFVSSFGLPRRDRTGASRGFMQAPVPARVRLSCTPGLGRGFRASDLIAATLRRVSPPAL